MPVYNEFLKLGLEIRALREAAGMNQTELGVAAFGESHGYKLDKNGDCPPAHRSSNHNVIIPR